jgi:hypothetical protein
MIEHARARMEIERIVMSFAARRVPDATGGRIRWAGNSSQDLPLRAMRTWAAVGHSETVASSNGILLSGLLDLRVISWDGSRYLEPTRPE